METGNQIKPRPRAPKREPPSLPKRVATQTSPNWELQSMHTQIKTTHTRLHTRTHTLSEASPVTWPQTRCTQTGFLAKQSNWCPRQFWPAAYQRLGWPFWGLREPPWLTEPLLLFNMPTHSPRCCNKPPIHSHLTPPLPPPARWKQTHACCLKTTKTCQHRPGHRRGSAETSRNQAGPTQEPSGMKRNKRENEENENFKRSSRMHTCKHTETHTRTHTHTLVRWAHRKQSEKDREKLCCLQRNWIINNFRHE